MFGVGFHSKIISWGIKNFTKFWFKFLLIFFKRDDRRCLDPFEPEEEYPNPIREGWFPGVSGWERETNRRKYSGNTDVWWQDYNERRISNPTPSPRLAVYVLVFVEKMISSCCSWRLQGFTFRWAHGSYEWQSYSKTDPAETTPTRNAQGTLVYTV